MLLGNLKKIINALPAEYDAFEVITLGDLEAQANGFSSINVPVNSVALDLPHSQVILVDPRQASIIQTLGKVPVKTV